MEKNNRYLYMDMLNVLACFSVVLHHHNSQLNTFDTSFRWVFSLIVECLCYWNVPIFLMLSGATLIGYRKKYDTKTFFRKRFIRTVIPWLTWSIILLIWKLHTGQMQLENHSFAYWVQLVLSNNVEATYWFFGNLFTCYLLIPVLGYLTPYRKILWYIVIVVFLFSIFQPVMGSYLPITALSIDALRNSLLIYFILGYLLHTTQFSKKQRSMLYLSGICASLFRFVATYLLSTKAQTLISVARGNKLCNSILWGTAAFIFVKQINWEAILPASIQSLVSRLASYSLGVYLIHKVVMYYLRIFTGIDIASYRWKTVYALATYGICILIVASFKKLPYVKKYIF